MPTNPSLDTTIALRWEGDTTRNLFAGRILLGTLIQSPFTGAWAVFPRGTRLECVATQAEAEKSLLEFVS